MGPGNGQTYETIKSYGGGTQTYLDTPTIGERTKVQHCLDQQEKSLHEAFGVLDALAQRLSPVLAPEPAIGAGIANAPQPTPMQFTTRLADHNRGINALATRIQSLLERLEL